MYHFFFSHMELESQHSAPPADVGLVFVWWSSERGPPLPLVMCTGISTLCSTCWCLMRVWVMVFGTCTTSSSVMWNWNLYCLLNLLVRDTSSGDCLGNMHHLLFLHVDRNFYWLLYLLLPHSRVGDDLRNMYHLLFRHRHWNFNTLALPADVGHGFV